MFVGSSVCRTCHEPEYGAWEKSHHALAMRFAVTINPELPAAEPAQPGAPARAYSLRNGPVPPLAGFTPGNTRFGNGNTVQMQVTPERRIAAVFGEGATASTQELRYILGVSPLEQPLVATDRSRLQALPVAWDSAAGEWFDVFSGEDRRPGDYGHWLGRGMNANSQCLSCHTTDYREGYDAGSDSYSSTWSEMGVGCEACHGPGATHVASPKLPYTPFGRDAALAESQPSARSGVGAGRGSALPTASASTTPSASTPTSTSASVGRSPAASAMQDLCATCHALRREIAPGFLPGARLLDHYDPVLLDEDDYEADGHVRGESYEWGSFLQSRMHERGVTCAACHDVHSGNLRAVGDALCLGCHEQRMSGPAHTGHAPESAGSRCVACHMPEKVFMARDRRRDHSLSIPDPLGSKESGIASACESCHADRGREKLAADSLRLWPSLAGERFVARRALVTAVAAARRGDPDGAVLLRDSLAGKHGEGAFLRASAAKLLARTTDQRETVDALVAAVLDSDDMVRNAAAYALAEADVSRRAVAKALLTAADDEVRAVRIQAAWALRGTRLDSLAEADRMSVESAFAEWRDATALAAEEPETQHNLGLFLSERGDRAGAEAAYRRAIAIEPAGVASRHNLAMVLIAGGRVAEAAAELESLVAIDERFAPAWYALGIVRGEQRDWAASAKALGRCLKLDPAYPGALTDLTHAYLEAGVPNVARVVLTAAADSPVARREALAGLVTVSLRTEDREQARRWAGELVTVDPSAASDPAVAELLAQKGGGPSPVLPSTEPRTHRDAAGSTN